MNTSPNRRILIVDDNEAIRTDYRKILGAIGARETSGLSDLESDLFGEASAAAESTVEPYVIDTASQGPEALTLVERAIADGAPYAMVFMDVRMPPGWDGIETIERLWQVDADLQAVVCTAFSDYSWSETIERLGSTDRLLILKKPFDSIEVCQMASALVEKWNLLQRERASLSAARKSEREARAYAASLETVNRALETTLATAEEAARAKAQFLTHLTHELLQPMAGLLGRALELEAAPGERSRWMDVIEQVCRDGSALRRLLGDIVELSDIESNRFRLAPGACAPLELAREVVEGLRPSAQAARVTLSMGCTSPVPAAIESDVARLRRVLEILVTNALRRSPAGEEVHVRLALERTASWQEPQLRVEVGDRGPALAKQTVSRLFEPFTERGSEGLELGLAKRLAHLLGGDLTAVSDGAGGTTFALTVRTGALDGVSLFAPGELPARA
jgi:two-component system sensor histidine kinase/response regulator